MGSAGASPRPLLNWVLAYLAAIYPTQNLRKPLRLESTQQLLDLTDRTAAAAWTAQIEQTTGGAVDVLVNNAGGVAEREMRPIEEVPGADWDRVFAVNIGAAFALSRAVAAGMKRAGSGRIVNISSGAGLGPSLTGIQAYC
jgi:3-oxoacyl-[acyl-carrier protein] reductase